MWVRGQVRNCDFTDREYQAPVEGAWVLAQGATGRYCTVMWAGPEYVAELEKTGNTIMTYDEAVKTIEGIEGAWVDF